MEGSDTQYESDSEPEEFTESENEVNEAFTTQSENERFEETGWDIAWKNFFIRLNNPSEILQKPYYVHLWNCRK